MTDSSAHDQDETWQPIGTVEILVDRVYPIDPNARETDRTTVWVPAGAYPVLRKADAIRWMMTGRLNERLSKLGDGLFAIHDADVPTGPEVRFSSPTYGVEAFREFLSDPLSRPGDSQRLRFSVDLPADEAEVQQ